MASFNQLNAGSCILYAVHYRKLPRSNNRIRWKLIARAWPRKRRQQENEFVKTVQMDFDASFMFWDGDEDFSK
ncbi:hypothetical protein LTS17_011513 [Exophiala oligosperma]